jgi:hypothetical protein
MWACSVGLMLASLAGPYGLLGKRSAEQPRFPDGDVRPKTLYFHKVACFTDGSAPLHQASPTCAWDSDRIGPNGSFELDARLDGEDDGAAEGVEPSER